MAEFCKTCAVNYGFETDTTPLLCEGCGKEFFKEPDYSLVVVVAAVVAAFLITLAAFGR